jgi:hypothetical protein
MSNARRMTAVTIAVSEVTARATNTTPFVAALRSRSGNGVAFLVPRIALTTTRPAAPGARIDR